jgi:site-specific recombinase XerD
LRFLTGQPGSAGVTTLSCSCRSRRAFACPTELISLCGKDVSLGRGPHIRCHGKGRKERATPLTAQTLAILRAWMEELSGSADDSLFPSYRKTWLRRDAVERLVDKYVRLAGECCRSLKNKAISPHVFRHSTAICLLGAGVDTSVIGIWLGHESV